jgi:uncharacterized protein (DUF433 family)
MAAASLDRSIVSDPARMGGVPCFRGTRVPVSVVFENLADGLPLADILANWPTLDRADVIAVLDQTPGALSARSA